MGDMGDYWRDHRQYKKEQKARFQEGQPKAFALLAQAGLTPERLSFEHYRIAEVWDWWPSTGRWRNIRTGKRGFEVGSLIKAIQAASARVSRASGEQPPQAPIQDQGQDRSSDRRGGA